LLKLFFSASNRTQIFAINADKLKKNLGASVSYATSCF
jgi:hypothetical protein